MAYITFLYGRIPSYQPLSFLLLQRPSLFVTPAIFKPGSIVFGAFRFPITNFGNDETRGKPRILFPLPFVSSFPRPSRERVRVRVSLPSKNLFTKNPPPLPTLPNQRFGREPGHSLPPGAGEGKEGETPVRGGRKEGLHSCFYKDC